MKLIFQVDLAFIGVDLITKCLMEPHCLCHLAVAMCWSLSQGIT